MFIRKLILLSLCILLATPLALSSQAEEKKLPEKESQRFSYSYGIEVASRMKMLQTDFDLESLFQGIRDSYTNQELAISVQEAVDIRNEFNQKRNTEIREKRAAMAMKNLEESQQFLQKNKTQKGIIATSSGLQYEILRQGDGSKPKPTDRVSVHYRGTLLDGTEFDSSYKREKPVTFPMEGGKNLIAGWTEALQLMRVGSKLRLFIPPQLGYGDRQAGPTIGPNSLLIFEVEMIGIEGTGEVTQ